MQKACFWSRLRAGMLSSCVSNRIVAHRDGRAFPRPVHWHTGSGASTRQLLRCAGASNGSVRSRNAAHGGQEGSDRQMLMCNGGGGWESNPLPTVKQATGFEDQGSHQTPFTSIACLAPVLRSAAKHSSKPGKSRRIRQERQVWWGRARILQTFTWPRVHRHDRCYLRRSGAATLSSALACKHQLRRRRHRGGRVAQPAALVYVSRRCMRRRSAPGLQI